jgi:hypothetical protein
MYSNRLRKSYGATTKADLTTDEHLFSPRIITDSIRFLTANGREYTRMSCYEKRHCERSTRRTACRPSGCEQENAAAVLSARNNGQQSFSAAQKHRHNPPFVYAVTSVFKIRIRDHARNPREKILLADALAKNTNTHAQTPKKLEIKSLNFGANNSRNKK